MKTYYSFRFSSSVLAGIMGAILLIPALVLILKSTVVSVLLIGVYMLLLSFRTGCQIDESNHRIKLFTSIMGIKFGDYIDLKKFESYKCKRAESYRLNSRGSSSTYKDTDYKLYLIEEGTKKRHLISKDTQDKTQQLIAYLKTT